MNRRHLFALAFVVFLMPDIGQCANILVTVMGIAGSQNLIMYRLAELMGQRGHNVTLLKAELLPETKTIPLKYGKEISYKIVEDNGTLDYMRSSMSELTWSQTASSPMPISKVAEIFRHVRTACGRLLDRHDFIRTLNDSKFDVIVIHIADFCTFGLTQVLKIDSYVWMTTNFILDPIAWYSGTPLATSYVPAMASPSDPSGRMSFLDRIKNAAGTAFMLGLFQYGVVWPYTDLFRDKYGHDFPSYDQIFKKTQLYFINADPFFEYARPMPENVINVGGLTMQKAEPLDKRWQKIVDNAPKEGIVIFSLGSVANTTTMPQPIRMSFLNAFKRFPHLFIWKFDGDFPEAKGVKNVHLASWLPQKDLMAHPKVKAAIIHGGYNSLTETTYLGVPVVVMPLWGDQFGNVIRVTRQNIGVKLERTDLTEDKVYDALNKVLYDNSIQDSAHRLGQMIREKPFSSLQQATEWLEYLAKFKRLDQLQPQSHDIYLFQYLLLDILLFVFGILGGIVVILALCLKCLIKLCRAGKAKKNDKTGKKNKKE